jgi:ERCC4-type nuclease
VGSKEFLAPLQKRGLRVSLTTLRSADFAWRCGHVDPSPFCTGRFGCRIGVERKTLGDMIGSLLKHRINKQVPDMIEDYTLSWILVEGIWRAGTDDSLEIFRGGWVQSPYALTYSQLTGWVHRYVAMGMGRIHEWRTSSPTETAAWIAAIYRWWQKDWAKHKAEAIDKLAAPVKALMFRPTNLQRTAASLDCIGIENAKKVGRHFASIKDMICADESTWQSLVGKKNGTKVWLSIRKDYR